MATGGSRKGANQAQGNGSGGSSGGNSGESSQALLAGVTAGGSLAGQKVNYLDSGYSEEDPNDNLHMGVPGGPNHPPGQQPVLVKTSSGSIYIPPSKKKKYFSK